MDYLTRSGNHYTFVDGRVTCHAHGVFDEPVWQLSVGGNLEFRTSRGWFLTTPIVETQSVV